MEYPVFTQNYPCLCTPKCHSPGIISPPWLNINASDVLQASNIDPVYTIRYAAFLVGVSLLDLKKFEPWGCPKESRQPFASHEQ
jgi:hypothetical protein